MAIAAAVIVAATLVWRMWLPSRHVRKHAAAVVELASRYELSHEGKTLLTLASDTVYAPAVWVNRWWLLPSCLGRLVSAPVVREGSLIPTGGKKSLDEWMTAEIARDDSILRGLKRQQRELRYYFRVHGVQDEGYEAIQRYAAKINSRIDSINHTDSVLRHALRLKDAMMTLRNSFTVIYKGLDGVRREPVDIEGDNEKKGYMRFRTHSKIKPLGAEAVSLWPWMTKIEEQFFVEQYGEKGFLASRKRQITRGLTIDADTTNTFLAAKYNGYGMQYAAGRLAYAGNFKNSRRQGKGRLFNANGKVIGGLFNADTLVYGTKTAGDTIYRGEMNAKAVPMGHGTMADGEGNYTEGNWRGGLIDGFGFAIGPERVLRAGEWKAGIYRGERVVYTSERIYGIDISRFQHEIGKKKYPIDWGNMRITRLGSISRKRIRGKVDYPVEFIYIKATEGTTVRNRYYAGDYKAAHKAGLHVGSYHFFSTTTAAKKQAAWFLKHAKIGKGDFPPVLDVEPSSSQIRKMGGEKALFAAVREWLGIVERHSGLRPVLYISQSFVNNHLPYAPDIKQHYPVWIARYGEYKPDVRLAFWQLSPDGRVGGIKGNVDINVFNGYRAEFNTFVSKYKK